MGEPGQGNPANLTNAGKGRPKGAKNKFSKRLLEDLAAAYEQRGGVEYLKGLSDKLFIALLKRRVAEKKQIKAEIEGANILVRVVKDGELDGAASTDNSDSPDAETDPGVGDVGAS